MYWENISQAEGNYIKFLFDSNCIRLGKFRLKEPKELDSPYFIDMQESFDTLALPVVGRAYGEKITELQPGSFNILLGPAEKGTALAIATAPYIPSQYGKVLVFWDRKQPKDYGSAKRPSWLVGPYSQLENLVRQQMPIKPLIEDDVITTGKAKKDVMNNFENEVAEIAKEQQVSIPKTEWIKILIAANRREVNLQGRNPIEIFQSELGLPIGWVTDSYNIYGYLGSLGSIPKTEVKRFVEYQSRYGLPEDKGRLEELKKLV